MAFLPQADNFQSWCGVIVGAGAVFQAQTEASSVERPVSSEMAETHQRLLLYSSVKDCSKYNIKELYYLDHMRCYDTIYSSNSSLKQQVCKISTAV